MQNVKNSRDFFTHTSVKLHFEIGAGDGNFEWEK